jgi:hypothetical protein
MNDESIFVQIASYRDPELVPTILDMFETAEKPENLKVCICWQHDDVENLDIFKSYPNIQIIDVPYKESRGACWARNLIQRYYNGERYTLQLDSHHRFVQGWDTELKNMYQQCVSMGSSKPLITAYIPSFDPLEPKESYEMVPWRMDFNTFTDEGTVIFTPNVIHKHQSYTKPIPARFYSAHFAFTDGTFCEEVQHDPEYYFYGEEISISVRAFTHGYDLYHPHKVIAWHEYTRNNRVKHWDDHDTTKDIYRVYEKSWWERDSQSQKRNRILFGIETDESIVIPKRYNFGTMRTLEEYERYAGIKFKTREVSLYTLSGKFAPTPYNENYVFGKNIDASEITSLTKNVSIPSYHFISDDVERVKIELYDVTNKVIVVQSFEKQLIKSMCQSVDVLTLTINFDALKETSYYCKFYTYDQFDRVIHSNKLDI